MRIDRLALGLFALELGVHARLSERLEGDSVRGSPDTATSFRFGFWESADSRSGEGRTSFSRRLSTRIRASTSSTSKRQLTPNVG